MVNWKRIIDTVGVEPIVDFANGSTYRDISAQVAFTDAAKDVRNLLRKYGIEKARQLARRALNRHT